MNKIYSGHRRTEHSDSGRNPVEKKRADKEFRNIENLLKTSPNSDLNTYFTPGGLKKAVKALAASDRVVVATGSFGADGKLNTDGIAGAVELAQECRKTKKAISFLTDSTTKRYLTAAIAKVDPDAAKYCRFDTIDVKEKNGSAAAKKEARQEAKLQARDILRVRKPDTFVAVNLSGANKTGDYRDAKGNNASAQNSMVDEALNQANRLGITTIAIANKANAAGMGSLSNVPNVAHTDTNPSGVDIQAATKAGITVTASTADLGAQAVGAGLMATYGIHEKIHKAKEVVAMVDEILRLGGVDTMTDSSTAGTKKNDGEKKWRTGVEGFDTDYYKQQLKMLKNMAAAIPSDRRAVSDAKSMQTLNLRAATVDSGAGGIFAVGSLQKLIEYGSGFDEYTEYFNFSDFGNAPYGQKTDTQLNDLVYKDIRSAETLALHVIIMACNTACTALAKILAARTETGDLKVQTPVLNLIQVTAQAIARFGGTMPVILSTEKTATHPMYRTEIEKAYKNLHPGSTDDDLPDIQQIGCGDKNDATEGGLDWATLINECVHLGADKKPLELFKGDGFDPAEHVATIKAKMKDLDAKQRLEFFKTLNDQEKRAIMEYVIDKYVGSIPTGATSIWLCCTHYPAIKDGLQAYLKSKGKNLDIIDPMVFQADAAIDLMMGIYKELKKQTRKAEKQQRNRPRVDTDTNETSLNDTTSAKKPKFTIFTSGQMGQAAKATVLLLGKKAKIVSVPFPGKSFKYDRLPDDRFYDLNSPSQSSLLQQGEKHEIYKRQEWEEKDLNKYGMTSESVKTTDSAPKSGFSKWVGKAFGRNKEQSAAEQVRRNEENTEETEIDLERDLDVLRGGLNPGGSTS